jgi:23S rRNA pseudouridine955/2504/2580 synthase
MNQSDQPSARIIQVAAGDEGQRIDNYLMTQLKGVPKSRIYRILRTGEVRVNSGRIKPTYRIKAGDAVRIPPLRMAEAEAPTRPGDRVLERVNDSIIYEDKGLLVVNKPSGLAVHGGSGLSYGLIEALRALRPEAPFLELGHRLDRDTSGCIVIAKKRSVLRAFHELLREGGSDKRYLALLKGRWQGGERRVEARLLKNVTQSGERMVKVAADGKEALTIFRPVAIYKDATLVEAELITGRTHQVRVHAAHIRHPIAGDDKYGDEAFNRRMAEVGLKRLFLHASALNFTLPESGQEISVSAPLGDELRAVIDRLEAE